MSDASTITISLTDTAKKFIIENTGVKDLDEYDDFIIVVFILCQDMYDNRTLYVDKNNIKHNLAFNILRGKGSYNLQDGFMEKNTLASYVHTHVAAMPNFGGNLCLSALEK